MIKPFYYFGIARRGNLTTLTDPIFLSPLLEIDEYVLQKFCEENSLSPFTNVAKRRGVLCGFSEDSKSFDSFLANGKLLNPDIIVDTLSIFFLGDSVLFKLHDNLLNWKKIDPVVFKILKPFGIISESEFKSQVSKLNNDEYRSEESHAFYESSEGTVSVGAFYCIFLHIKPKNYASFVKKVKSVCKEKPLDCIRCNCVRTA